MKSNHEKRKEFQRGLSENFDEMPPSTVTEVYWLYAQNKIDNYKKAISDLSGKWLVFVNKDQVDQIWRSIKEATELGKLGDSSKVATDRSNPNAKNTNQKVICVYTYDWTDEEDVKRIREELRNLGITLKIPYKADKNTLEGKYANRGNKRISKYYE